ncbi:MAG: VCBS repeat-containing protein, partial [Bacteroidota bacterium]|nr:VCBS repeat-containing protein [Bacteroidota bacterium]
MKSFQLSLLFAWIVLATTACKESASTLFVEKKSQQTGVDFENKMEENESFNIMTYEYLYNGAGVAVGDVNNDGLADIYFTGNMVPNKLFINKGNFKFEDITSKAGVAGRERWKTGTTMADVNGDGLLDIYVCYSGPGTDEARKNELYINNGPSPSPSGEGRGEVSFSEKAAEYGLDAPGTFTTQCAFFDMDRDGDLDAFMVNHADMFYNAFSNTTKLRNTRHPKFGNRLYRNDNGKFTDISQQAGIFGSGLNFGLSVSVSDLNNDNWPDLYVTNDYNEQDFLYLNNQNGTFREVLKQSMGHISQFSMGSDIEDYNNDLQPDVFTLDMLPEDNKRQKLLKGPDGYDLYTLLVDSGFHHQNMRNMLQLNMGIDSDGIPQFSEIGQLAGISNTDWSWAPLLADFDNDGWKDIYITNGYLRDFTNLDFLKFTYAEAVQKARENGKEINTWELIKQLPSTKISNYIFSNNHNLTFSNKTTEWGLNEPSISTGAAYADLDNDGDLDLVVNNSNQPAFIYENNSNKLSSHHYLKIKLKGPGANTQGIGAKVIVTTDSTEQLKELYTTKGFQSSVEPVLHFGLGNQSMVKSIKVIWPDGKVSVQNNSKADVLLTIDHAQAADPTIASLANPVFLFSDYSFASGLSYQHHENNSYVDFKTQFLLPHQVSKQGPFLTKGDVNGDGLEDVFVGGNMNQPGQLYLQINEAKFVIAASQPWTQEKTAKDAGVVLFDADGDKDIDLFISKGGTEFPVNDPMYQAVLYLNNGKGVFTKAVNALPALTASSSCIVAADYDKDGDTDIFIGGRSVPGNYPVAAISYLLRNESRNGIVKFEYASEQPEKLLRQPGMVTTATWA